MWLSSMRGEMHKHKACEKGKHDFKFCQECNVVWCENCEYEWSPECTLQHQPWYWTTTNTGGNDYAVTYAPDYTSYT